MPFNQPHTAADPVIGIPVVRMLLYLKRHILPRGSGGASAAPRAFLLVLGLLTLRCAGQIPPGGGSTDTVPPAVIRTIPDTNAVRVKPDRIELEFSEYVDRQSVEESIFIAATER